MYELRSRRSRIAALVLASAALLSVAVACTPVDAGPASGDPSTTATDSVEITPSASPIDDPEVVWAQMGEAAQGFGLDLVPGSLSFYTHEELAGSVAISIVAGLDKLELSDALDGTHPVAFLRIPEMKSRTGDVLPAGYYALVLSDRHGTAWLVGRDGRALLDGGKVDVPPPSGSGVSASLGGLLDAIVDGLEAIGDAIDGVIEGIKDFFKDVRFQFCAITSLGAICTP